MSTAIIEELQSQLKIYNQKQKELESKYPPGFNIGTTRQTSALKDKYEWIHNNKIEHSITNLLISVYDVNM